MNAIRTMLVAAAFALAASAHAQDCSGGADGGMDATGNQCSRSNPSAVTAATSKMNLPSRNGTSGRAAAAVRQVARPEGTMSRERAAMAVNSTAQLATKTESDSIAPRAVKVSATTGAN